RDIKFSIPGKHGHDDDDASEPDAEINDRHTRFCSWELRFISQELFACMETNLLASNYVIEDISDV
ncbi:MAG TPA: hypothetical protein DC056_05670, partial [Dehalococcoidia bacterium]|nr:hypothetical protein [Dehalococcoidia bacterium]